MPTPKSTPAAPVAPQSIQSRPPHVTPIAIKPSTNTPSPGPQPLVLQERPVSQIGPSKTWILPPRPKPGRKPSSEAPPSKRKAQNRDAQRAFRERRAARVSELETKIEEIEKARDEYVASLRDQISILQNENSNLQNSLDDSRREAAELRDYKARSLSSTLAGNNNHNNNNNNNNSNLMVEYRNESAPISPYSYSSAPSPFVSQNYAASTPSGSSNYMDPGNRYVSDSSYDVLDRVLEERLPVPVKPKPRTLSMSSHSRAINPVDSPCLVCTKKECLCETYIKHEPSNENMSLSPKAAISLKENPKKRALEVTESESMEIDFTTVFGTKKKRSGSKKSSTAITATTAGSSTGSVNASNDHTEFSLTDAVRERLGSSDFSSGGNIDPCGFCSDGTPCVCREAASQESQSFRDIENNTLPPLLMPLSPPVSMGSPSDVSSYTGESSMSVLSFVTRKNIQKLPVFQLDKNSPYANSESGWSQQEQQQQQQQQQQWAPPVDGCSGNPGNCSQCRADPMSTLFCTTIASLPANEIRNETRAVMQSEAKNENEVVSLSAKPADGCCGGSKASGGGGCCKDKLSQSSANNKPLLPSTRPSLPSMVSSIGAKGTPGMVDSKFDFEQSIISAPGRGIGGSNTYSTTSSTRDEPMTGTYIPCAAAYQTLSRHKDFNRVDLATLVGKLTTRGMQVEVSSVANVLRELDRRLYQ